MAARKAGWDTVKVKGYRIADQEQYDDFSHLRQASAAGLIQRGRTPVLRLKILAYWGEVKELKADGMGFRPMVKSTLSYFMQAYWKRSNKAGGKIELATALFHDDDYNSQALNLIARQKNGIQSLEVSLTEDGRPAGEVYLGAQELIMLDITIGKAIGLLTPEMVYLQY